MSTIKDRLWWEAAVIRAIKTIAQTAIASIGASALIESVDWKVVVSASLLAGLVSLLTSLKGLPEVELKLNQFASDAPAENPADDEDDEESEDE